MFFLSSLLLFLVSPSGVHNFYSIFCLLLCKWHVFLYFILGFDVAGFFFFCFFVAIFSAVFDA